MAEYLDLVRFVETVIDTQHQAAWHRSLRFLILSPNSSRGRHLNRVLQPGKVPEQVSKHRFWDDFDIFRVILLDIFNLIFYKLEYLIEYWFKNALYFFPALLAMHKIALLWKANIAIFNT